MKTIVMMITILLLAVINTHAGTAKAQPGQPKATFNLKCSGTNNDVSFFLNVTNKGPGDVPKGTRIAYSYDTSAKHVYGQTTLGSQLDVNQTETILINSAWQTAASSWKCYVK
jgi:hypothetical protein